MIHDYTAFTLHHNTRGIFNKTCRRQFVKKKNYKEKGKKLQKKNIYWKSFQSPLLTTDCIIA